MVPPDDGDALAERLQLLLDDAGRRRAMGARGRALVERDFDAARNVPRMLDLMKGSVA